MNVYQKLDRLAKRYQILKSVNKINIYDYALLMKDAGFSQYQAINFISRRAFKQNVPNLCDQVSRVVEAYEFGTPIKGLATRPLIGKHSREEWESKKQQYGGRCAYCGNKAKLTKDHIIPVSKGGPNTIENIVPACWPCNFKKRARPIEIFKEGITPKFI